MYDYNYNKHVCIINMQPFARPHGPTCQLQARQPLDDVTRKMSHADVTHMKIHVIL